MWWIWRGLSVRRFVGFKVVRVAGVVLQRQLISKFQMVVFTKLVSYTRISHAAIIRHGCFLVRLASNTTLK